MAKGFVAVTFSPNQLVDKDTLQQMNANINWLRDNSVDGLYQHPNGGGTTIGLKILCGRSVVTPRQGDDARIRVSFNSFFTSNSQPIVTHSITSTHQTKIFSTIEGIGTLHPNHNGFVVKINVDYAKKKDRVRKAYINWIAMGY